VAHTEAIATNGLFLSLPGLSKTSDAVCGTEVHKFKKRKVAAEDKPEPRPHANQRIMEGALTYGRKAARLRRISGHYRLSCRSYVPLDVRFDPKAT